jgi:hypothetical protein
VAKREPVAARGERVGAVAVRRLLVGAPPAAGDALDEREGDPVALDRQRVVGVELVGLVDPAQIGAAAARPAGRRGQRVDDLT